MTDIISSPYPGASVVPSLCRATFDRRTLVGETEESVLAQVNEVIDKVKERIPQLNARCYLAEGQESCWTGERIAAKRFFPAWLLSEDDAYVQKVRAGLEKAGIHAPISHFAFCTNGSHFCGERGIPTIGLRPLFGVPGTRGGRIHRDRAADQGLRGFLRNSLRADQIICP